MMNQDGRCDLSWDDLDGDNNVRRHCGHCNRNVYNLSGMKREEAARLLKVYEGKKLCIHFVRRDGVIVHDGDPLQQLRSQQTGSRRLVAAALAVQAAFIAFADEPAEAFFDPFAAAAATLKRATEPVEEKWMGNRSDVINPDLVF